MGSLSRAKRQSMSKNVIIVGMPRSGTSVTARAFTAKGYFIGEMHQTFVREGDDRNPFGYFEADDLVAENVRVLKAAGFPFHNTWLFSPISQESIARIADLPILAAHHAFLRAYDENAPWVWKDPRLCFTLAYWWRLMDPAHSVVVLVRRDPIEIYWSFQRMGWCKWGRAERDLVFERVRQHTEAATTAVYSLGIPHAVVNYREYLTTPELVARRLSKICEIQIGIEDLNVRPDLNHSSHLGKVSTHLRRTLKKLPQRPVRKLEVMVPRRALQLLFPERKYVDSKPDDRGDGRRPIDEVPDPQGQAE
jgi:hypothetical protein